MMLRFSIVIEFTLEKAFQFFILDVSSRIKNEEAKLPILFMDVFDIHK
jgi:hypothetical protein